MQDEIVVVVAAGEPPLPEAAFAVPLGTPVIAADGGLEHARALGLDVATVIGDLDSVGETALEEAAVAGARVVRHPAEKDATDLELALDAALALGPARILVLAGDGGRLDHLLGMLLLLASSRYAGVQIDGVLGGAHVHVVRDQRVLSGGVGELVSLFALHGPAEGVSTEGLAYALERETLEPGSSRGVSNVFASQRARVRVEQGVLLAIRPGLESGGT